MRREPKWNVDIQIYASMIDINRIYNIYIYIHNHIFIKFIIICIYIYTLYGYINASK